MNAENHKAATIWDFSVTWSERRQRIEASRYRWIDEYNIHSGRNGYYSDYPMWTETPETIGL